MTFKKRYLRLVHLLFIVLLLIQLLPDKLSGDTYAQYVVWFAVGVEILTLIVSSFIKKPIGLTLFVDIVSFIYGLLIAWTLATAKFNLLKPALFPPPGRVFWQLIGDYEKIITNIFSSVGIILQGYLLAAASAIILGLLLGSSERLGNVATYISKFLGAIPPIVYIPYGIALLPTFRSVSVFVIFLATFWPVLAGTMSGVMNVDKKTIDSAKVLNVGKNNHAVFCYSPGVPAANLYRLQSGAHRFVCPADLSGDDRRTERIRILHQKLLRSRRLHKNARRLDRDRHCDRRHFVRI